MYNPFSLEKKRKWEVSFVRFIREKKSNLLHHHLIIPEGLILSDERNKEKRLHISEQFREWQKPLKVYVMRK